MPQLNLLAALPKTVRDVKARADGKQDGFVVGVSRRFGKEYFDGERKYGYGGYKYDGRWVPVAQDIIKHYGLKPGQRVLDIGCAKGFLVKDLLQACPGLEVFGLDISPYALRHCEPEVVGRLHFGTAHVLDLFPDASFDLVLSLNTLHNLDRQLLVVALREIIRVGKGPSFIQVDSYFTPEQKAVFESWVLTARFHDYPDGWLKLFAEVGYQGDYDWTLV